MPSSLPAHSEPILDPDLPIVDTHHHLWPANHHLFIFGGGDAYTEDVFAADIAAGHNIVQTVFVECEAMWRDSGPDHMKPVGEAEFVRGVAERQLAAGKPEIGAGFVGFADLRHQAAAEVLDAMADAAGGRFRGIRQSARWQAEDLPGMPAAKNPKGLMSDADFRRGFAQMAERGLSFDAWQVFDQLPELLELVRLFPAAQFVICHIGAPVGTGSYAARPAEVETQWRASMRELAREPNVAVKLGGMGMPYMGYGFETAPRPVSSQDLAAAWRPRLEWVIETFGEDRCMFESNFPVDRSSCSYVAVWNAFKRVTAGCSLEARRALFAGNAQRIYRLPPV